MFVLAAFYVAVFLLPIAAAIGVVIFTAVALYFATKAVVAKFKKLRGATSRAVDSVKSGTRGFAKDIAYLIFSVIWDIGSLLIKVITPWTWFANKYSFWVLVIGYSFAVPILNLIANSIPVGSSGGWAVLFLVLLFGPLVSVLFLERNAAKNKNPQHTSLPSSSL